MQDQCAQLIPYAYNRRSTAMGIPPRLPYTATVAAASVLILSAWRAEAVPSFARQTGMACEACHTVYPELSHFGRVFKANGYVLDNIKQVRDVDQRKQQLLSLAQ